MNHQQLDPVELLPPPHLPPEVEAEIRSFEAEVDAYRRGEMGEEKFRAYRLGHGIYGQRQPGVQMVRVKIPGGFLQGRQLRRLADLSEAFGSGITHLTTRQDAQFHYVKLRDVPRLMRLLADVGLTTREACANSVRNVTACPHSGVIRDELFLIRPYALAVSAFLLRNPFCQQMGRKFKIALSACPEDCAATAIHDIGILAAVEGRNGGRRAGFRLLVGGGLGVTPFPARLLWEFLPAEELLITVRAILKVFTSRGNRRRRMRARMKFLVHDLGIDTFRGMVEAEQRSLDAAERAEAALLDHVPEEFRSTVALHLSGRGLDRPRRPEAAPAPERFDPSLARWRRLNVQDHVVEGKAVVTVLVPLGDLEAGKLRSVADLVSRLSADQARISVQQNLILPHVAIRDLREVYDCLRDAGLAGAGIGSALDITSCPGADTCALGITSSKGLTRVLAADLAPDVQDPGLLDSLEQVRIKISGCPNGCGQHHVADIGLHGVVKRVGGRQIPAYQLHLGGHVGHGTAHLAPGRQKVPARNVPALLRALLGFYVRRRKGAESFHEMVARLPAEIEALVEDFLRVSDDDDSAVDWGGSDPFTTAGMGKGECAGAGSDVAADPLTPYVVELDQAARFIRHRQWADAAANLQRSHYTLANILLAALGKHPESDYETACEVRARILDRGYAGDGWEEVHRTLQDLLGSRAPDPERIRELYARCRRLVADARTTLAVLSRVAHRATREKIA